MKKSFHYSLNQAKWKTTFAFVFSFLIGALSKILPAKAIVQKGHFYPQQSSSAPWLPSVEPRILQQKTL